MLGSKLDNFMKEKEILDIVREVTLSNLSSVVSINKVSELSKFNWRTVKSKLEQIERTYNDFDKVN